MHRLPRDPGQHQGSRFCHRGTYVSTSRTLVWRAIRYARRVLLKARVSDTTVLHPRHAEWHVSRMTRPRPPSSCCKKRAVRRVSRRRSTRRASFRAKLEITRPVGCGKVGRGIAVVAPQTAATTVSRKTRQSCRRRPPARTLDHATGHADDPDQANAAGKPPPPMSASPGVADSRGWAGAGQYSPSSIMRARACSSAAAH